MNRRAVIVVALAVFIAALATFQLSSRDGSPAVTGQPGVAEKSPAPDSQISLTPGRTSLLDRIGGLLAKLRHNGATAADLAALRRDLFADPAAGIAAIRRFLATGENAATGQRFVVGAGGALTGAPTLRLFLLDILGQLARRMRADDAAEIAREILEKKDSPDEWALALRNVAWGEPKSREFLAGKMHEMLNYEPWLATPSKGMLEAFDVAVFSGDPTFVSTFANMRHGDTPPLQQAAIVALDRLAETSPLAVMEYLNAHPDEIADLPFVRADYFAKADLRDAQQRGTVEQYLARIDVTADEKTKFLHAIASPGSFVSESLLSTAVRPGDTGARDAGIAAAATDWLKANRYPTLNPHIGWLLERVTLDQ